MEVKITYIASGRGRISVRRSNGHRRNSGNGLSGMDANSANVHLIQDDWSHNAMMTICVEA